MINTCKSTFDNLEPISEYENEKCSKYKNIETCYLNEWLGIKINCNCE